MDQADLVDAARIEGRSEGRTEGAANVLSHLLTARFGPLPEATGERIRVGTVEDHDRWAERLLTADSLDEVFLSPGDA